MADTATEIRKLLADKRLAIGTERTMKMVRRGELAKVYLSSNCPPSLKDDFKRYCALDGIECQELPATNDELGVWCKKPFAISVVGVMKSAA